MRSNVSNPAKKYQIARIVIIVLIIVVAATTVLEVKNVTHFFHKSPTTASSNAKGTTPNTAPVTKQPQPSSTTQGTSGSDSKGGNITPATLVAPIGDFVSNHHPSLSGTTAPNSMVSVCNTSVGASCKITFTNTDTGVVKSLPAQVTDQGGSTYWDWKLQDIGLTAGTWKITAIASLGNQTKSANDAMNLEVTQ